MPPGPQSAACALQRLPRLWHQESREISNDRFEGWHFRRQVPGERFPLALFFRVSGERRRQRVRQILRDHGPAPQSNVAAMARLRRSASKT